MNEEKFPFRLKGVEFDNWGIVSLHFPGGESVRFNTSDPLKNKSVLREFKVSLTDAQARQCLQRGILLEKIIAKKAEQLELSDEKESVPVKKRAKTKGEING
jgi:hypothetical protein